jgi:hypothetical protein
MRGQIQEGGWRRPPRYDTRASLFSAGPRPRHCPVLTQRNSLRQHQLRTSDDRGRTNGCAILIHSCLVLVHTARHKRTWYRSARGAKGVAKAIDPDSHRFVSQWSEGIAHADWSPSSIWCRAWSYSLAPSGAPVVWVLPWRVTTAFPEFAATKAKAYKVRTTSDGEPARELAGISPFMCWGAWRLGGGTGASMPSAVVAFRYPRSTMRSPDREPARTALVSRADGRLASGHGRFRGRTVPDAHSFVSQWHALSCPWRRPPPAICLPVMELESAPPRAPVGPGPACREP